MRRETSVRKGGDERRFVLPWSCTYFSKLSIVTPPADAAKYDVDQKEPWLLKVLNSGNLSRIIFEELVFKNPTRFETEICGGICSSKWIWSASPLISSTHSLLILLRKPKFLWAKPTQAPTCSFCEYRIEAFLSTLSRRLVRTRWANKKRLENFCLAG